MERLEIIISPNMESLLPQVPVSKTEQVNVQVNVSLEQKLFFFFFFFFFFFSSFLKFIFF